MSLRGCRTASIVGAGVWPYRERAQLEFRVLEMVCSEDIAVVILSPVEWDFTWQSAHNIARGLAAHGYQVLFVNPLPKRVPGVGEWKRVLSRMLHRPRLAGFPQQPRPEGVSVVSPSTLPDSNPWFAWVNEAALLARLARRLERAIGPRAHRVVVSYLPFPTPLELTAEIGAALVIYACQTNHSSDPLVRPEMLREQEMFLRANVVLADSRFLYEHAGRHHQHVLYWPALVDFELFHRVVQARRDHVTGGPVRCCYFGDIGFRIDTELLAAVSYRYPLRLIGPVRETLPAMGQRTEVLGARPHPDLPSLLLDVDVLLLPYRVNEFTEGILPAKLYECFATGKPVVSTRLSSLLEHADLVHISRTRAQFLASIEQAIHEAPFLRERRVLTARQYTTDRWIGLLSDMILRWMGGQHDLQWPRPAWAEEPSGARWTGVP